MRSILSLLLISLDGIKAICEHLIASSTQGEAVACARKQPKEALVRELCGFSDELRFCMPGAQPPSQLPCHGHPQRQGSLCLTSPLQFDSTLTKKPGA